MLIVHAKVLFAGLYTYHCVGNGGARGRAAESVSVFWRGVSCFFYPVLIFVTPKMRTHAGYVGDRIRGLRM